MRFFSIFSLALLAVAQGTPIADSNIERASKPPAFFLAGDSTTAVNSGWGDGFMNTLANGSVGKNLAKSGATTASFVSEGLWANVLAAVETSKATYTPFVTIQFGHNDQKLLSVDQFKINLSHMVNEVVSAGGVPVLVTALTRRSWDDTTNSVLDTLKDQVAATREVAAANHVRWIDLNAASMKYMNAIGCNSASQYNLTPEDETHLNVHGEKLFGNMVANLIATSTSGGLGGQTSGYLMPDPRIIAMIEAERFILP